MTYHDATYADLYEETLYNALLGSMDLEGKNFYYQNPLVSWSDRYGWHGCPCCVGNIPRVLLMLPTWTYVKSDNGVYVNLFIGSRMDIGNVSGTDVEMVQTTDYPWNSNVEIVVNPQAERNFTVYIRLPNRSVSKLYSASPPADGIASISVNGSMISPAVQNGYAAINRMWKVGDKITLLLPMKIQRIKGIDKIDATKGQVALRYGPLIYNVERIDQNLDNILRPDVTLTTEWKPDLLDGVNIIKGKWADGSELTAIPNYARNNRTNTNQSGRRSREPLSSVWIKDQ